MRLFASLENTPDEEVPLVQHGLHSTYDMIQLVMYPPSHALLKQLLLLTALKRASS
jgi:hypothetical protein